MDLGVLANLELHQVEPEALGLPNQVLYLRISPALIPSCDEGVLQDAQITEQLLHVSVRQIRISIPRGAQPISDHRHHAAMRLIWRTGSDLVRFFCRQRALGVP